VTSRSEPLLWLQLIALGAIPLELLLLLLLLAGADPGPVPALERLLVWGLGALAPALLFWQRPPDCCSLLLVQVPLRGRSPLQLRLSRLQEAWVSKLLAVLGAALLLPLLWTLDSHAAFASRFSPLSASNRFIVLLLSLPLLAVLLWQWQQLVQAFWLLTGSAGRLEQTPPMTADELAEQRLCLGLPLLLLDPLQIEPTTAPTSTPPVQLGSSDATGAAAPQPGEVPEADGDGPGSSPGQEPTSSPLEVQEADETTADRTDGVDEEPVAADPEATAADALATEPSVALEGDGAVAVEPEQAAEEHDGTELDQDIL
jgi:hypothetical protein